MAKQSKSMKAVKPSVKGMSNMGHLGHFAQDKFIQQGHNSNGKVDLKSQLIKDDDNTNSVPIYNTQKSAMGPDIDKPTSLRGNVMHNPAGGYSIIDYDDPDYLAKVKKMKGSS